MRLSLLPGADVGQALQTTEGLQRVAIIDKERGENVSQEGDAGRKPRPAETDLVASRSRPIRPIRP